MNKLPITNKQTDKPSPADNTIHNMCPRQIAQELTNQGIYVKGFAKSTKPCDGFNCNKSHSDRPSHCNTEWQKLDNKHKYLELLAEITYNLIKVFNKLSATEKESYKMQSIEKITKMKPSEKMIHTQTFLQHHNPYISQTVKLSPTQSKLLGTALRSFHSCDSWNMIPRLASAGTLKVSDICTGGMNCKKGEHDPRLVICEDDLLWGKCKCSSDDPCRKRHLSEEGVDTIYPREEVPIVIDYDALLDIRPMLYMG